MPFYYFIYAFVFISDLEKRIMVTLDVFNKFSNFTIICIFFRHFLNKAIFKTYFN